MEDRLRLCLWNGFGLWLILNQQLGAHGAENSPRKEPLSLRPIPIIACVDDEEYGWATFRQTLQQSREAAGETCAGFVPKTVQAVEEALEVLNTSHLAEAWLGISSNQNLFALCGDAAAVTGSDSWAPKPKKPGDATWPLPKVCVYGIISALACLLRAHLEGLPLLQRYRDPIENDILLPVGGESTIEGKIITPEVIRDSIWRMLRTRIFDYLTSSGWPFTPLELAELVSRARGRTQQTADIIEEAHLQAEVIRKAATAGFLPHHAGVGQRQSAPQKISVLAFSLHAPLLQEQMSIWEYMADTVRPVADVTTMFSHYYCKAAAHRPKNPGKFAYTACSVDPRITELLQEYINVKGHARESLGYKFPEILDYRSLKKGFRERLGSYASSFDVLMCGEPTAFCGLFPAGPAVVAVVGTPLGAYLRPNSQCEGDDKRKCAQQQFYTEFFEMAANPRNVFVTTSLYLSNQAYWNAGVLPRYLRPLGLYTGAHYMPKAKPADGGEVLLSRIPYLLWDHRCVLRHFAASSAATAALKFVSMPELEDRTYGNWASHSACLYFPYDPQLLTFHELYGMGVPMFLPKAEMLPLWISPGFDTLQDFAHRRPGWAPSSKELPYDWAELTNGTWNFYGALRYWSELTDFAGKPEDLPGLFYYDTVAELFSQLLTADLKAASSIMQARSRKDLLHTVAFWTVAFANFGAEDLVDQSEVPGPSAVASVTMDARKSSSRPWPVEGSDSLCWDPPQGFGSGRSFGSREQCCQSASAASVCFDDHLTFERCCSATSAKLQTKRSLERGKLRDVFAACVAGSCTKMCATQLPGEAYTRCEAACRSSRLAETSLGRALHCLASRPEFGPVRMALELGGDGKGSTAVLASSLAAQAKMQQAEPRLLVTFEKDLETANETWSHLAKLAAVSSDLVQLPKEFHGTLSSQPRIELDWASELMEDHLREPRNGSEEQSTTTRVSILRGVPYPYPKGPGILEIQEGQERPNALRRLCEELLSRTGQGFDIVFLDIFQGSSLALEWPVLQDACAPRWVIIHNVNLPEHAGWIKEHLLLDPRWAEVWGGTFEDLSGIVTFAQPLSSIFRFRHWSVFHRWGD